MPKGSPEGCIALFHSTPDPYRLRVFNHLNHLTGGKLHVVFISNSSPQGDWNVRADETNFQWSVLARDARAEFRRKARIAVSILTFLLHSKPSVVASGGYDTLSAWISLAWCKLFRRRFVLWVSATARDDRRPSKVKDWLKRLMIARADAVAAAGRATVEYARQLGARTGQLFLVPNGFDIEFFAQEAGKVDPLAEKRRRGYPPQLILCAARLVPAKGVFTLLEAFRQLMAERLSVGLLIVGEGPARGALEDFCRSSGLRHVFFLGAQPYDRMPYYYALADVLVHPTFSDTWGFVVAEAFACGVPAIVSRVAGVCDDLIVEGETGLTVEPGNGEELARKIVYLLQDQALRARMSTNCRRLIKKYSVEACAGGLLAAALGATDRAPIGFVIEPQPEQNLTG